MEAAMTFRGPRWAIPVATLLFLGGLAAIALLLVSAASPVFAVPGIVVGLGMLCVGWYDVRVGRSYVAVAFDGLWVRNGWTVFSVPFDRIGRITIEERHVTLLQPFALRAMGAPPTRWDVVLECADGRSLDLLALRAWPKRWPYYSPIAAGQTQASAESAVAHLRRQTSLRS